MNRSDAVALDAADPLASFRDAFVISDPELIYLDGNSLGRLPVRTAEAMTAAIDTEWGNGLVRSWHDWIDLPEQIGDAIAPLIGARTGEVLVADQTSVNLFKLASAAVAAAGRADIVTDDTNFPSDHYVLRAVAERAGGRLRVVATEAVEGVTADDIATALDEDVALVSLSHVAFKSGALADMAEIEARAESAGALTLWDLSHSVGAVPIELERSGASLAVGCTYKYLNGGPGAPAFLYVRRDLHDRLATPIPGWFGHADMFRFDPNYVAAEGIRRFASGTPPIVSLRGVEHGVAVTADAGIEAIRTKSIALTEVLLARADVRLRDLGCAVATPRRAAARGSHVAIRHADAHRVTQALIDRSIIPDFRAPDTIRLGVAPLYTRYTDVYDAIEALAEILETGAHRIYPEDRGPVT